MRRISIDSDLDGGHVIRRIVYSHKKIGPLLYNLSCAEVLVGIRFDLPARCGSRASNWQAEWDKILRAAESEGQLTLYGCCYEYDRVIEGFKKKHPKIKVATVLGSGNQLAVRILAERRGEKFIPDVVSAGANTLHDALYKAQLLEPIKPELILPEVLDTSKWFEGEHRYIDPEKRYIFAFVANSQSGQIIYNVKQVNSAEFKSYWDLVNPKWKGKMASLDPTSFGMGATLQFFYFHPELGPAFLRRLYGEMQVDNKPRSTADDRLACPPENFLSAFAATPAAKLARRCSRNCRSPISIPRIGKRAAAPARQAARSALPTRAPHPNAAKIFINWLLSREGQIGAAEIRPS